MSLLMRRRMLLSRKKKSRNLVDMYNYQPKYQGYGVNVSTLDNGYIRIQGGGTYADIWTATAGYTNKVILDTTPLLQAGTYTISWLSTHSVFIRLLSQESLEDVVSNFNLPKIGEFTFTIAEPCYLRFGRTSIPSVGYADIGEIMLNEGTEALPYEPYEE